MSCQLLLQLGSTSPANFADESEQRIIVFIYHPLFEWNDGVVGDADIFGAHFSAALGDVAETEAQFLFQHRCPRNPIQRMHVQRSHAHEETWSTKLFLLAVLA